jgi:hypothetical protein
VIGRHLRQARWRRAFGAGLARRSCSAKQKWIEISWLLTPISIATPLLRKSNLNLN